MINRMPSKGLAMFLKKTIPHLSSFWIVHGGNKGYAIQVYINDLYIFSTVEGEGGGGAAWFFSFLFSRGRGAEVQLDFFPFFFTV